MLARRSLGRDCRGAAAAEMALVLPFLLVILFGSLELGNYFMNEHTLVKAVRNGARFAARQSYTEYPDCSTVSTSVRDRTRDVVMAGILSGGQVVMTSPMTPNVKASDIDVTTSCKTTAGGQAMSGIYAGRANGAQIVTVSARVNYRPVLASLGFSGVGMRLNATSQAAVMGM